MVYGKSQFNDMEKVMKPKEVVLVALNGQKADRCPVTVPYTMLCYEDHYGELTGNAQPNPIGF